MRLKTSACLETLYPDIKWEKRFITAKADGFDFVELWGWRDKDIRFIQESVKEAKIGICAFNGDDEFSLIDPDHKTDYLDFIKESISMALKLRSKSLTIHSNALDSKGKVRNRYNNIPDAVKLATMKATLKKCATLAEKAKITLNLEALNIITDHVGNYLSSTQLAADLTRKIASPNLKILYDVYHMQLNEGNLVNNLVANIDQIGHIHVADVPGRHEPGTGEINYPFIFSTLKKLRYSRLVGFELFPRQSSKEAVKAIQKSLT